MLKQAAETPKQDYPRLDRPEKQDKPPQALIELLRVLLKHVTEEHEVAPRLIASADDLEKLALDDKAGIPALSGWRYEIFGQLALELKQGAACPVSDKRQDTCDFTHALALYICTLPV